MWTPLTRADWLVMLYGAVSGVVSMHLQGLPFPANIFIGAFVGFFLMLSLVVVTKVFLMWEYMRIPVAVVRAVRILLIGVLTFTLLVAVFTGDWPVAILITWLLIPLLLLFCQPKLIRKPCTSAPP